MSNSIKTFLLGCSGADLMILGKDECAIEHNKYMGIGATVLSTAALAAVSAEYALYTVFQSIPLALFFGVLWGTIIFNLDRYIVSSIRKADLSQAQTVKQRVALRLNEVGRALPRLILAVFISIIITKPIELRLFQPEIDAAIADQRITKAVEIKQSAAEEFAEIGKLRSENKSLTDQIREKEKQRYDLEQQKFAELDGWGGSHRPGDGPIHKEKLRAFGRADSELRDLNHINGPLIKRNDERIAALTLQMENRIRQTQATSDSANGLLRRMETLNNIASEHSTVQLASAFIVLLFILLETAPIFVKLLSERGPYDEVYESIEHEVRIHEYKKRLELDDEMSSEISLTSSMRSRQLAAELDLSRKTMESLETLAGVEILEAQTEIARHLAAKWKRAELNRIRLETQARPFSRNGQGTARSAATSPVEPEQSEEGSEPGSVPGFRNVGMG
jgi:DNA-binding XRE family transcriptional regulator